MVTSGGNLDSVRRGNLSTALEIVHRSGGATRSRITAETGLNRSTVAALVGELVELELVLETEPEATRRVGRPSPLVVPHPAPVIIAVNPEVDAVTIGVVGLGARVEHRVRHEVDHLVTPAELTQIVAHGVDGMRSTVLRGRRVVAAGLAIPALVSAEDGLVRWAPHLLWRDEPIGALIAETLGVPASVGNDASLGAQAEHLFGAGRGVDDLIYLNGGASGIGGGVILAGRAIGGVGGYAGEFGQNRPGLEAAADRVTAQGTLEDEVNRARLLEVLGLASADEPELARRLLASTDERVLAEVARQRRVLSVALSNAVNVLNPELIVLGGFLATLHEADPEALRGLVASQALAPAVEGVRIRPAALGDDRLLIGAAEIAFAALLAAPSGA